MTNEWFYAVDGVQYGPVTVEDLRRFIAEERLSHEDVVWNGTMAAWAKAGEVPELVGEAPLFAVGIAKLLFMSAMTLQLYLVYWMFMQWNAIRVRKREELSPFWRAIFSVFFFFGLVNEINEVANEHGFAENLPAGGLATVYVLGTLVANLPPDWIWIVGFLCQLPVAVVQHRINRVHTIAAPLAEKNRRLRRWNWLAVVLGIPFFLLVIIGTVAEP